MPLSRHEADPGSRSDQCTNCRTHRVIGLGGFGGMVQDAFAASVEHERRKTPALSGRFHRDSGYAVTVYLNSWQPGSVLAGRGQAEDHIGAGVTETFDERRYLFAGRKMISRGQQERPSNVIGGAGQGIGGT